MDKTKIIEEARRYIAKGQLDKAAREYQRVLDVDPDDVRVLQKLAELYQKMQRRDDAADCFEKVAKTYAAQGFYLKAVALYKQVLKVVDRIAVNIRLAELYQQLGLVGDATKEWQVVAAYYEKMGDFKQSLDTIKKLVDLDPDNVAARIRLGEQYARQDSPAEAVAELRRAATYLQRNDRTDDYLRVAERISHLDPGDVPLAKELAENYLSKGDSKRALAKLQICFKANPRDLGTLQLLARAFQELGQTSKTVSVLKELARVYGDAGNVDDARRVFQQAQALAPDDAEIKAGLQALEARQEPIEQAAARPKTTPIQARRPATGPIPPPGPATGPIATDPLVAREQEMQRPRTQPVVRPPPGASPPPPPTGQVSVSKLLKETEVYVKYGLHEKALDHLRKIFAVEPENLEAHEKAKQLALAMNRPADAAASLSVLVRLYAARSDPRAEQAKVELAQVQPPHPVLEIGPSLQPAPSFGDDLEDETKVDPFPPDVEEPEGQGPAPEDRAEEDGGVDVIEEFAAGDEEHTAVDLAPPLAAQAEQQAQEAVADPERELASASPASGEEDVFASELEEADFYIDAGLPDDARGLLEGILLAAPEHPGALARLAKLGGAQGTAPAALAQPAFGDEDAERTQVDARPPSAQQDDLASELAAELASEVAGLDPGVNADTPLDPGPLDAFQAPLREAVGEFRAKVQEAVSPEDAQTHYDLGIAYKEMGLGHEAVSEFEIALQHGGGIREADCISMLASCAMENGHPEEAVHVLLRGLSERALAPTARRALMFDLAGAYEAIGEPDHALEQYQNVERAEPGFRDVAQRIQQLGGTSSPAPATGSEPGGLKGTAQPATTNEPSEAAVAQRRNRKIGFV